jgi:thiamine-phosphate pyrophosphorylase
MSRLTRTALALERAQRRAKGRSRLPGLWLVTDPRRTPDPVALARTLPRGAGVIYRAFGAGDALATARALRRTAWRRGLVFLVGADAALATAAGADGVHLPERLAHRATGLRRAHPKWRITAAAHSRAAMLRAGRAGIDAVLVSAVFPSRSPSAGVPLGPVRFAALIRGVRPRVIALGGVNESAAPRLLRTGAAGLAAVEALAGGEART